MNEEKTQIADGVASELNAELGFETLLAKAVQIANERECKEWQIIRKMLPVQAPKELPKNHTLFVGSIAYSMIENTLGYVPLFVEHSGLLKPEQVCLASNFVSFDRLDFKYF